jgi:hypothetical protein
MCGMCRIVGKAWLMDLWAWGSGLSCYDVSGEAKKDSLGYWALALSTLCFELTSRDAFNFWPGPHAGPAPDPGAPTPPARPSPDPAGACSDRYGSGC